MKKCISLILAFALLISCAQIPAQAAWQQKNSNWYYTNSNGSCVTGWKQISNTWYYFDNQGVMQTGWQNIGGVWYYFASSGAMSTGWLLQGGLWYYLNSSGAMVTGTATIDGKLHSFNASGVWLGEIPQNGWAQESGKWVYYQSGAKATGWKQIDGIWYFFNKQGIMQTDWQNIGCAWYYFASSGAMQTGWLQQGSIWYYMNSAGAMVTGTVTIGGKQHIFNASGVWLGETESGWAQESGKWVYYQNGVKVTGWNQIDGIWYFFNNQGIMQTGWQNIGNARYCFNISGAMLTGWQQSGETRYYFDQNGMMVTGWKTIGQDTYYFYASGIMAANTTIDGVKLGADGKVGSPSGTPSNPSDPDDDDLTTGGRVKLSIGLPTNAYIMDYDDNALTNWIEEQCGVELEFIEYAGGTDVSTQISTTIAARQELPDILFGIGLEENTVNRYGREGYLVDLAQYMYDEDGNPDLDGPAATYWDRINNELTEKDRQTVLSKMAAPETGAVYGMPAIETSLVDNIPYQLWINTEWLEKVGMEMPTNNEELLEVLRAFKNLGIPLFGSQNVNLGSRIVDWLINLFVLYNPNRPFLVNDDGKLSSVYTDPAYREALQFVYDLYKEDLISGLAWTAGSAEMKQITTPSSGEAIVGLFAGHLSIHAMQGNEVLYEYAPLKTWGNTYRRDVTCSVNTFITADCKNTDKAFEVLMKLFSWDGSMRIRYGEYGVNWTDADSGAKSDLGLDAKYKLHTDPLRMQNTAIWGKVACCLNIMAEGEEAQSGGNLSPWHVKKSAMHAESNRLFEEAEAEMVESGVVECPPLRLTEEEKEEYEMYITNVGVYASRAQTDFCKGLSGCDPYSDTDWENYCSQLNALGLADYMEVYQAAFDRISN